MNRRRLFIIAGLFIALAVLASVGIYTYNTFNQITDCIANELKETFKHANRIIFDSRSFRWLLGKYISDPSETNYNAVNETLDLIGIRIGVIERSYKKSRHIISFDEECAELYTIYDTVGKHLDLKYPGLLSTVDSINSLLERAESIEADIAQRAEILANKQVKLSNDLLQEAGNRILLFLTMFASAILVIAILSIRQIRTAQHLRNSELKFKTVFYESVEFFWQLDPGGRLLDLNNAALRLSGEPREKLLGIPFADGPWWASSPELRQKIGEVVDEASGGKTVRIDIILAGNDGKNLYMDFSLKPVFNQTGSIMMLVSEGRDITDIVEMQEKIIQSEKMLSVGGLAAGMAHEINNPLAGMMQTAEVIYDRLTVEELDSNRKAAEKAGVSMAGIQAYMHERKILEMLDGIRTSGLRAASIVDNMLSFSRKSPAAKSPHDIGQLLLSSLELASTDYNLKKKYDFRNIRINKNIAPNLPPVLCEAQKIQQVFLNILKNGAQAMSGYVGELKQKGVTDYQPEFIISVRAVTVSDDEMPESVIITIEDNGPGMTDEVKKRIFEPFYTTKAVGEGTGLGLSVSYFIITENHKGTFSVETEEGRGSRFIIRLPAGRITSWD